MPTLIAQGLSPDEFASVKKRSIHGNRNEDGQSKMVIANDEDVSKRQAVWSWRPPPSSSAFIQQFRNYYYFQLFWMVLGSLFGALIIWGIEQKNTAYLGEKTAYLATWFMAVSSVTGGNSI